MGQANGNRWTRERVCALRSHRRIPVYRPALDGIEPWFNLTKASAHLDIAPKTLRLAAEAGKIAAIHPLADGPWLFKRSELEGSAAQSLARQAKKRQTYPTGSCPDQQNLFTSAT